MSAPATNAFSPAPVRITTRVVSSEAAASMAVLNSFRVCALSAFRTLGRLKVIVVTGPSRSTSRFSKDIDGRLYPPGRLGRAGTWSGWAHVLPSQRHDYGHGACTGCGARRIGEEVLYGRCASGNE